MLWALVVLALLCAGPLVLAQIDPFQQGPRVDIDAIPAILPAKSRELFHMAVENDGPGRITNVSVDVRPAPGSDLVVLGESLILLDDPIEEDDSGFLSVHVATGDDAGGKSILVTVFYEDEAGIRRNITREVSLQVGVERSDFLRVEYVQETLVAGRDGRFRFIISNPTRHAFTHVDLDLVPSATTGLEALLVGEGISTSRDVTAGRDGTPILRGARLEPGESITASIPVRTSRKPGDLVPFSVDARYQLAGYEREQRFEFGARLAGGVAFRLLDLREERVGGLTEITGVIVNVGTATAWNPQIRIPEGAQYKATRFVLVSDLEPNDPVTFRVATQPREEGGSGVLQTDAPELEVEWNDDDGKVHTSALEGEVFAPPQESVGPTWRDRLLSPWTLVAAAIALLFAAIQGARRWIAAREEAA